MMTQTSVYFEKLCRTCMSDISERQVALSVFGTYSENSGQPLTIADCLKTLAEVEIEESDGLPPVICRECIKQLDVAYSFKRRCEETHRILKLRHLQLKIPGNKDSELRQLDSLRSVKKEYKENIASRTKRKGDEAIKHDTETSTCSSSTADRGNDELLQVSCTVDAKITYNNDDTSIKRQVSTQDGGTGEVEGVLKARAHACKICQRSFVLSSTLTRHLRLHNANSSQAAVTRSPVTKGRRAFPCGNCSKIFTSSAGLAYHKQTHADKTRSFECEVCNKIFTSSGGLTYHRNVHSGVKNYSCDVCSKRFVGHTNLLLHKRRHTREFSHLCSTCGKKFLTFGELRRHMRKHTDERPFQCPLCQKRFTTNVSLSQHRMRHTGEKPYLCYVCSKRFTTSANLNEHMRSHTGVRPHHCSVCNKGCISTSDLKKHLRTHSGEKPYICQECGKGFARSGSLKVHMRTHTGQKPYECSLCGKRFGHSGSLAKHVRKHEHAD